MARLPFMVDVRIVATAFNVSEAAVHQQSASGKFPVPVHKIGRVSRWKKTDIEAFLGAPLEEILGMEDAVSA